MVSFYPGPSKLYKNIPLYFKEAYEGEYLSINHRSSEFIELSHNCIKLLKQKLEIPHSYSCFYTSSATECWEIIALSLIKEKSVHYFNGSFGQKWWEYTKKLSFDAIPVSYNMEEELSTVKTLPETEIVCITQNETSNGTAVSNEKIRKIKELYPHSLIAVDATSSMGGIQLDFQSADIWFASVQKCFGLPAGLALLICSPQAIRKARILNKRNYYNSLIYMAEMMEKWQTTYTPNVLNIFLLKKVLENIPPISTIQKIISERSTGYYQFIEQLEWAQPLVKNVLVQSKTVIALSSEPLIIDKVKEELKRKGIVIGNGYGIWAKNTLRIANFPALEDEEVKALKTLMLELK